MRRRDDDSHPRRRPIYIGLSLYISINVPLDVSSVVVNHRQKSSSSSTILEWSAMVDGAIPMATQTKEQRDVDTDIDGYWPRFMVNNKN